MNNSTNRIEFLRLKRICLIHSTRSKLFLSFLSSTVENISPKTYCRWFYAHSRCYKNCFQINNSSSLDRNFNCETFKLSQEWKWKVKNLLKFKFVMNFCWKFGFQNEVKAFNFCICDFSEIYYNQFSGSFWWPVKLLKTFFAWNEMKNVNFQA